MEALFKANIERYGIVTESEHAQLEAVLTPRSIAKGMVLLQQGAIASKLWFLLSGHCYQYRFDAAMEEQIVALQAAGDWVIQQQSFVSRAPSEYEVKAYSACTLYELTIDAVHGLIACSPGFFKLGQILDIQPSEREQLQQCTSPTEQYRYILEKRPELLQGFPQKMIASYLNMTPETLSRTRKKILRDP